MNEDNRYYRDRERIQEITEVLESTGGPIEFVKEPPQSKQREKKRMPSYFDDAIIKSYSEGVWGNKIIPARELKDTRLEIYRAVRSLQGPNGEDLRVSTRILRMPKDTGREPMVKLFFRVRRADEVNTERNQDRGSRRTA